MPELPDVEGFREVLASCGGRRVIRSVEVYDTGVLHGVSARRLRADLEGRRLRAPRRHGKWLIAPTSGPTLLFHFGMTGALLCADDDRDRGPHDRVVLGVGTGRRELRYRDQRKLKGLWLAEDRAAVDRLLSGQGPDALGLDRAGFTEALAGRRGGVKSALTDQSVLAGLGNLLADEICWRARLHPATPVRDLGDPELRRLHTALRGVLRTALPTGRVPPRRDWLTGHRDETGADCPRCGTALRSGRTAGRTTVWCPHCQPG